jgi:hypothetical protein
VDEFIVRGNSERIESVAVDKPVRGGSLSSKVVEDCRAPFTLARNDERALSHREIWETGIVAISDGLFVLTKDPLDGLTDAECSCSKDFGVEAGHSRMFLLVDTAVLAVLERSRNRFAGGSIACDFDEHILP